MATHHWLGAWAVAVLALHPYDASAQRDDDDDGPRRNVTCVGELGAVTVDANLEVSGRCTLAGTEVLGHVTLFGGGSLTARGARIDGDLETRERDRADFVDIDGSRIGGNVRLAALVGDESSIALTEVEGNVALTANDSRFEILNNELGRDLTVLANTGGVLISGNAVDRNLSCHFNLPAPTGVGNVVDRNTDGQCENLLSEPEQPVPPEPPPAPSPPAPPAPAPAPPAPAPTPAPTPAPAPAPAPPAAAAPPTTIELAPDEGGAGAMGWPIALLLPLLAWRRRRR
jgi:hypothetical protein